MVSNVLWPVLSNITIHINKQNHNKKWLWTSFNAVLQNENSKYAKKTDIFVVNSSRKLWSILLFILLEWQLLDKMHCHLVNCVIRLLYGSIVVFPFTLSVTAFRYSDFDAFLKRTSIYKTFNSTTHGETNWDGNFHSIHERFPKNLSDVHFHSSYHMKGFLRLLTTGLKEPIEVWYNKEHRNSRIDFYNGMCSFFKEI